MAKIAPTDRQSLLDIAVQTSGGVEAAFDLAAANDVSVSEPLEAGAQLETAPVADKMVLERYTARQIRPATELSDEEIEAAPFGGIGYMGIEVDFMVR